MAFFDGSIYSPALGMMTSLAVSLPEDGIKDKSGSGVPVVYLLHGLSDNHSAWFRRTNVEYYAELANAAIVMPEVQRSFYTDMAHGAKYFTYIAEDLPRICRNMFHISDRKEDTYIAGLSMGGYGALKTALRYPERFNAVASFSGAVNIHSRLLSDTPSISREECIGINDGVIRPEDDLYLLAEQAAKKGCPRVYMSCGLSDFLYEDNKNFREHLNKCGIPFVYEEWQGYHDWEFWEKSIKSAMHYFFKGNPLFS